MVLFIPGDIHNQMRKERRCHIICSQKKNALGKTRCLQSCISSQGVTESMRHYIWHENL